MKNKIIVLIGGVVTFWAMACLNEHNDDLENTDYDFVGLIGTDGLLDHVPDDQFDCIDRAAQLSAECIYIITVPCRGYRPPFAYPDFSTMTKRDVINYLCGCFYSARSKRE